MRAGGLILLVCLTGCGAGTYAPRARGAGGLAAGAEAPGVSQAQCDRWTAQARGWGASAAFSAGLAGSGGIGVASAQSKSSAVRIGLGSAVAVLSAWSGLSAYLSASYAAQRAAECAASASSSKP